MDPQYDDPSVQEGKMQQVLNDFGDLENEMQAFEQLKRENIQRGSPVPQGGPSAKVFLMLVDEEICEGYKYLVQATASVRDEFREKAKAANYEFVANEKARRLHHGMSPAARDEIMNEILKEAKKKEDTYMEEHSEEVKRRETELEEPIKNYLDELKDMQWRVIREHVPERVGTAWYHNCPGYEAWH